MKNDSSYLDSNVILAFLLKDSIHHHDAKRLIMGTRKRKVKLLTSSVSIFEIEAVCIRRGLEPKQMKELDQFLRNVKIINTTLKDFEKAEKLSSDHRELSVNDALHLVVAKRAGAHIFLTFDKMLQQVSQKFFRTRLIL